MLFNISLNLPEWKFIVKEKQMEDILVVDDDKIVLELIERILKSAGIVAHCAASGEEALERIKGKTGKPFSLMITDLNMPGLDGLELSRQGLQIAPQMSIIMSTGSISPRVTRLAMEIGISRVVAKPFRPQEMLETIRVVTAKSRGCNSPCGSATGSNGAASGGRQ